METPEINLPITSIEVKAEVRKLRSVIIPPTHYIFGQYNVKGLKRIRMVSRWAIFKVWLYRLTKIKSLLNNIK